MEVNKILQGDCLEVLKTLDSESIDCCVTSPPYWGLRDYGTATWEGGNPSCDHHEAKEKSRYDYSLETSPIQDGDRTGTDAPRWKDVCPMCGAKKKDEQLGLEKTPGEYVASMVAVFREVKRVLKKEGTLWLNLGDSYSGSNSDKNSVVNQDSLSAKAGHTLCGVSEGRGVVEGLKPKDLVGIPWRVAFALQADGWYLRQDIIWHKTNPMPESVTDRCTKAHEYVFLLAKSNQYYFDSEAIKETATGFDGRKDTFLKGSQKYANGFVPGQPAQSCAVRGHERWNVRKNDGTDYGGNGTGFQDHSGYSNLDNPYVRNKRSVWTVTTKPYSGAHFATFPEALIIPMIKAGCPEQICKKCGKVKEKIYEKFCEGIRDAEPTKGGLTTSSLIDGAGQKIGGFNNREHPVGVTYKHIGFTDCGCKAEYEPGIVLDPFSGAGTTAMVAKKLWRRYIGIELNPEYVKLAENRIYYECGTLF